MSSGGTTYRKVAGHFEESLEDFVKVGGVYVPVVESYIKENGVWANLPLPTEEWFGVPVNAVVTTTVGTGYDAHGCIDQDAGLTGPWSKKIWASDSEEITNQRINVAYTVPRVLSNLKMWPGHDSGNRTVEGARHITVYGTNNRDAFENTQFNAYYDLTELFSFELMQHSAADVEEVQDVVVPAITEFFQYYIFAVDDNWGGGSHIVIQKIEMFFRSHFKAPVSAKATSEHSGTFDAYNCFNPLTFELEVWNGVCWVTPQNTITNQKLNCAFDQPRNLKYFTFMTVPGDGAKDVILYGTNSLTAYNNVDYADLTDLTELHSFQAAETILEPGQGDYTYGELIEIPNTDDTYQYYVFRIANNWGSVEYLVVRNVEFYFDAPLTPSYQPPDFSFHNRFHSTNDLTNPIYKSTSENTFGIEGIDVDHPATEIYGLGGFKNTVQNIGAYYTSEHFVAVVWVKKDVTGGAYGTYPGFCSMVNGDMRYIIINVATGALIDSGTTGGGGGTHVAFSSKVEGDWIKCMVETIGRGAGYNLSTGLRVFPCLSKDGLVIGTGEGSMIVGNMEVYRKATIADIIDLSPQFI